MNQIIKDEVWERDESKCKICNKKLIKVINEYENYKKKLLSIDKIPVYKFEKKCWKCGMYTSIITYYIDIDFCLYTIGSINKFDKILLNKYSNIKIKYSHRQEMDVIANTCSYCDILQGNYYLNDELFDDLNDGIILEDYLIDTLEVDLCPEDLEFYNDGSLLFVERLSEGHIHHIDHNRDNNDLSNLVLLCRKCHFNVHNGKNNIGVNYEK